MGLRENAIESIEKWLSEGEYEREVRLKIWIAVFYPYESREVHDSDGRVVIPQLPIASVEETTCQIGLEHRGVLEFHLRALARNLSSPLVGPLWYIAAFGSTERLINNIRFKLRVLRGTDFSDVMGGFPKDFRCWPRHKGDSVMAELVCEASGQIHELDTEAISLSATAIRFDCDTLVPLPRRILVSKAVLKRDGMEDVVLSGIGREMRNKFGLILDDSRRETAYLDLLKSLPLEGSS